MPATNFDVIIDGVKARLAQGEDGGGYKRRSVRREIQNQIIAQSENPTLRNREDGVALYQTSWAGGARWWKPLLTPTDLTSYFQANHMDLWSEPGKVVPGNQVTRVVDTNLQDPVAAAQGGGSLVAIGSTVLTDSTNFDVYTWSQGSGAFIRHTATTLTSGAAEKVVSIVHDPNDGYFYIITVGDDLERFKLSTGDEDPNWITTGFTQYPGTTIFLQNQNLMLYDGNKVYNVSKSAPDVTEVFDDGMGPDALHDQGTGGPVGDPDFLNLAVSTPQGVYYVKNTVQGGVPVPWVFRVDRDASGQYIGNPIATLPQGSIAFDVIFHLGQLIIATTPQWFEWAEDDSEIVLYFVGEGGMGSLGSILGNRDELDETPFALVGTDGPFVFLSGQKRLWVYDAIRGGLHTVFNYSTDLGNGAVRSAHRDSTGSEFCHIFMGDGAYFLRKTNNHDDPDTVTAFGDDETHYTLESNVFDGGVPMEQKTITRVAIFRDKDDGGSEWTLQISADDGAFTDVLVSAGTSVFDEAAVSISGYHFRYKLIYQTKDTERSALRALLIEMATGDMVTEWDMTLDGSELMNLDNQRQNPNTFYDNMVALAAKESVVTFVDNYTDHERTVSTGDSGTKVKVVAVEIMKDVPGESAVRVLLREA